MRIALLLMLAAPLCAKDAARFGDAKIPLSEVDKRIEDALAAARRAHEQKVYELRREALAELLEERLLDAEAKRRGVDRAALLAAEVDQKVSAPDEATLRAFYAQYADRMQGASFEQVRSDIADFLAQQARQEHHGKLVTSLRSAAKVRVLIEPPRVKVAAEGAGAWGPKSAPITVVAFADFECPFCARGAESVEGVREKYGDKVRVVFRDYPLPFHENAVSAAIAARCAGRQQKFKAMHDALFAVGPKLSEEKILAAAKTAGLDLGALKTCRADPGVAAAVEADRAAGSAAGVEGTPAFFVNGILISGAQPVDAFAEIIDEELERRR